MRDDAQTHIFACRGSASIKWLLSCAEVQMSPKLPYICKTPRPTPINPINGASVLTAGYQALTDAKNIQDAYNGCSMRGGWLAGVEGVEDRTAVLEFLKVWSPCHAVFGLPSAYILHVCSLAPSTAPLSYPVCYHS